MRAKPSRDILRAIASDNSERLKKLLEAGFSPDTVLRFDPRGRLSYTLLECAADKGAEKVAALLIKAGAKVNEGKRKPLILATAKSYVKIVKLLLDAGADANVKGNDDDSKDRGLTALMYAVWPPYNPKLLELLLARGADPQVVTEKGNTALSRAIAYGNPQAAKRLLKAGCKADGTLLSRAVYSGELDLLRLFIAAGADVNVRGGNGQLEDSGGTLLDGAVERRAGLIEDLRRLLPAERGRIGKNLKAQARLYFTIVQELIRAGADPNNFVSVSPLYWAVKTGDLDTVKLLLEAGADPNRAQDLPRGMTLHEACRNGFVECLIPLQEACRNGFVGIVECLLKAGADVKMKNDKGRTALEELRQMTKSYEIEILEKSIQAGHQKVYPGIVEAKYKEWNENRARLIQILEKIPGSERRTVGGSAGVLPEIPPTVPKGQVVVRQKDSSSQKLRESGKLSCAPTKRTVESNRDSFGENLLDKDCELPDGSMVTLWVATDRQVTEWCYFSIIHQAVSHGISQAWYRVFRRGTPPADWRRMEPIEQVYKKTGIDDNGSESEAKIGAAEKLPPGEYLVEAKVRVKGKEVQLGSLEFVVK